MKNNKNKGYLLAETIIAITVVATVITIVYATVTSYLVKQDNEITKYNSPQGLYNAMQIEKLFSNTDDYTIDKLGNKDYILIDSCGEICTNLNISKVYFSKPDITNLIKNEQLPIRIKRFLTEKNKTHELNGCDYKYVIIYNDDSYTMLGSNCDE